MLQLENRSPFEPGITLFPDENGVDSLYVAIKATFVLGRYLTLANEQLPLNLQDEYWGDPAASSLKYACDVQLAKPTTDVAVIGQAWAPNGRLTGMMDVRFAIAERNKTLRVSGNRYWKNNAITAPEPFKRMPIVYEYAFGGQHFGEKNGAKNTSEERNPVGKGFRGERQDSELENMALPNIEDPQCQVSDVFDKAVPAGFGFIAPTWMPRRQFAGTYDEAWQNHRSPYLPTDFDSRFLNYAHPDFVFDRYLQGGEPVELDNLSGRGPLRFALPKCKLKVDVSVAGKNETLPVNLDTIVIEPESDRLSMTWRSRMACDKKALKIEKVVVDLLDMNLDGAQ